jgi:hypothetical protein
MACGVSSNGSRHIVGPKMIATVANGGGLTKSSTIIVFDLSIAE